MRSQLLLVPAALCIAVSPAWASARYLSGEEAQQLLFPGAQFTEDFRVLSDREWRLIKEVSMASVERTLRIWKVSTGGWFIVDQVEGLNTPVTYALALNADRVVTGVEVMESLPEYAQVRLPEWRAQFHGKKYGDLWKKKEIENISGTTLSCVHITQGIRKILTAFDLLGIKPVQ